MAQFPDTQKASPPSLTEWSAEVAALAELADRIGVLIRLTAIQVSGKRQAAVPPYPRPVTAADRIRRRRRHEKHIDLRRRLLPDRH